MCAQSSEVVRDWRGAGGDCAIVVVVKRVDDVVTHFQYLAAI